MNEGSPSPAISAALARNLTTARNERGMTLGGLAESSGVADSILSGIEWGKQTPTIELVSRLANALGVSFGCLLQSTDHPVAVSENGVQVTLIDRQDTPRIIETYLMDLCPSATRYAGGHPDGVEEQITVLSGVLTAGPRESPSRLIPGQSLRFRADGSHIYRSGSNPVRASVTVIYPEHKHDAPTVFDVSLPWPDNSDDWRIVGKLLERAHIEVQNGVDMRRILFTGCPLDQDDAIENLEQYVLEHRRKKGSNALQVHVLQHPLPGLCILWRGKRLSPLNKDNSHTAWDTAYRMAQMAADNTAFPAPDPITRAELMQIAGTGPTLHAALAAEALTLHGLPSTPSGISCKDPAIRSRPRTGDGILFEDRIDVDAYEAYELVHPAYARQVLALAGALQRAGVSPRARLLDIGTGPGLPLEMLLQLMPGLQVTALDPSETAFRHLQKRFSGHPGVTMLQCGIDSFENTGPVFDAAISVGASHHLDTALFFRATADTLADGASFVVSDEMIAPFRTIEERQLNLVAHHLHYVADTLVPIPYAFLSPEEGEVVRAFRRHVPVCLSLATARLSGALSYVRDLFRIVDKIPLPEPVSHPLMAFYRFHILELQALVAGLDYEVEQKTYAQRLVALADAEGFSCVHHQRLYKTQGNGEWDAGTHLFTFHKQ